MLKSFTIKEYEKGFFFNSGKINFTMKLILLLSASVVILQLFTANGQGSLKMFEGLWKTDTPRGAIYEEWKQENDSLLHGQSYMVHEADTIPLETITLRYIGGRLCYVPIVKEQNEGKEVFFPLKEITDNGKRFVFENEGHDFPQRIIYRFIGTTALTARIEGTIRGREKSAEYPYERVNRD